jgi:hypothetical protein
MRNLLALLAALLLLVAGVGWYRDWFKVHSQPADAGHHKVNIDIDTHKIGQDLHQGEQKLQRLLDASKEARPDAAKAPATGGKSGKETKTGNAATPHSDAGRGDGPRAAWTGGTPDR